MSGGVWGFKSQYTGWRNSRVAASQSLIGGSPSITAAARDIHSCGSSQQPSPATAAVHIRCHSALSKLPRGNWLPARSLPRWHLCKMMTGQISLRQCNAASVARPFVSITVGTLPSTAAGVVAAAAAKLQALVVGGSSHLAGLVELYAPYVPAIVAPLASAWDGIGAGERHRFTHTCLTLNSQTRQYVCP